MLYLTFKHQIVKKVDNQSEFNPSTSLQQSIYTDQNQLVNYQQQQPNTSQLYSNNEQYEQLQSNYSNFANYYTPTAVQSGSQYIFTQTSTDFQNYDVQQQQMNTGNLPPPLDLNQQNLTNQQIYQPNYSNYAQQTSPYFDQQWQPSATPLSQQITPLSAYQQQQFNFNQYTQDNQLINIGFNQPTNQFLSTNQLSSQHEQTINQPCQINNQQLPTQYSQTNLNQAPQKFNSQLNANLQQSSLENISNVQNIQNVSNVSNVQNVQNVSTIQNALPSKQKPTTVLNQQQNQSKPIITSAAAGKKLSA